LEHGSAVDDLSSEDYEFHEEILDIQESWLDTIFYERDIVDIKVGL